MSAITGSEPTWWHVSGGHHFMRDPRTVPGYPREHWDGDERRYVAHLEAHEREASDPQPREDDTDAVKAVFAVIENAKDTITKSKLLILALRQQEAEKTI